MFAVGDIVEWAHDACRMRGQVIGEPFCNLVPVEPTAVLMPKKDWRTTWDKDRLVAASRLTNVTRARRP